MAIENRLWVEKWRPRTVEDSVIPERIKKTLNAFLAKGDIPNLILASNKPGSGKTTTAKAIANQLGFETMFVNASLENGIDLLRDKIGEFAATRSLQSRLKCVILDECDYANPTSLQPALRGFMETFSNNVRFIITCNYIHKLIPPLISRCTVLDFNIDMAQDNPRNLCLQMRNRIEHILQTEGVEYSKDTVTKVIAQGFPDWRKVINDLQRYSATGKIDDGIFVNLSQDNFVRLVKALKEKNFRIVREWIGENQSTDTTKIFSYFYEHVNEIAEPSSIPDMIMILSEYQYKSVFVIDQEVNLAAMFAHILKECNLRRE